MERNLWSHLTFTISLNAETEDFWVGIKFHDIFFPLSYFSVISEYCADGNIQISFDFPSYESSNENRVDEAIQCKVISMTIKTNASWKFCSLTQIFHHQIAERIFWWMLRDASTWKRDYLVDWNLQLARCRWKKQFK